jgi:RNA polymerase sigma-70 factor (ECF subfamily)
MPFAPPRYRALDPQSAAEHLPRLRRFAGSLCGSSQLAEDLTQETYVRILARPRRVHGESEFPYLARTLRNVYLDHWRSEQRRPPLEKLDHEVASARGHGDPELARYAGELYEGIAELPDDFRRVVVAIDVAGMSYLEASGSLRIPLGTVMSRLHRARARLVDSLEPSPAG